MQIKKHIYLPYMMKIKQLLLLVCIAGCFTACVKNNTPTDNFDVNAQLNTDTLLIRKFITDNKIPAVKDKSGVFYQIINPGTGSFSYTTTTTVTANYDGRLLDGTVFDSSKGTPISFPLNGVIAGWQIGVPFIQKGGQIRLFIPSKFGYGPGGQGPIPPNTVLDFTISLTDLK